MIVTKDLRVDVLGEPTFEKVNLVIQPNERLGMLGAPDSVATFMRTLAGDVEMDEGTIALDGARVAYISPETLQGGADALMRVLHDRPTFIILNALGVHNPTGLDGVMRFIAGFRGGMLVASEDEQLMKAAKVTRILELHASTKLVTSYTGSYAEYLVEREKNQARIAAAYEKQQKEKRRLEEWLEVKRTEAASSRKSPEKGATIRAKVKYLQREILDKEIPNPGIPE